MMERMKRLMFAYLLLGATLGFAGPVRAVDDLHAARALYGEGAFLEAAALAGRSDGAAAALLAARSFAAAALLSPDRKEKIRLARLAEPYAARALEAEPENYEAHMQYALAIGLPGRYGSALRAYRKRLAPRSRRHLEAALALAPDRPEPRAALGEWHMEVARRGGGMVYGGRRAVGERLFEEALALAPDNPAIAYRYALALAATKDVSARARAVEVLTIAIVGAPEDAFASAQQEEAKRLSDALAAGPKAAAAFLAARL